MTDEQDHATNGTASELSLEQVEQMVRNRIARIDNDIEESSTARKALDAKIKSLRAEREQAVRMLPRAPRKRQTSG